MREMGKWIIVVLLTILIFRVTKRESLIGVINRKLPPAEAVLLRGMVVGDKSGFDKELNQKLINSGLIHLVVVSGGNVLLLTTAVIEGVAGFLGRKKTIVMALTWAWGYAGLVNWEIPVVRAVLFLSIMYLAQLWGRKFEPIRGLGLVVLIMIIGEPRVIMSLSFWLSLMAFVGVLTGKGLNQLSLTIWISWWLTPVLGKSVGSISLISPLANMAVVGLTEIITGWGGVLTLLNGVGLKLLSPGLNWLITIVEEMGRPETTMKINFNWWMVVGWYLIMIGITKKRHEV